MSMKLFTTLGLLVAVPLSALAFEFEKVEPEKAGFDSEKLAEIQGKFEELYQEGRIPNYVMGVYSGDKHYLFGQEW